MARSPRPPVGRRGFLKDAAADAAALVTAPALGAAAQEELADIFAFLRALPAAKPAREIPLLEQLREKR